MIVQCPNCRTTYKVADEVLKGSAAAFRCSRCKHTFELESAQSAVVSNNPQTSGETPVAKKAQEEDLHLPFEQTPEAVDEEKDDAGQSSSEISVGAKRNAESQRTMTDSGAEQERPFFIEEVKSPRLGAKDETPQDFQVSDPLFGKLTSAEERENSNNIFAISPYLEQRASVKPFVTLCSILVIGFSLLAVISYAHPGAPEAVLNNIPVLGRSVLKNNHLRDGILLKSLTTSSQNIQGNREVILVTGVAVNGNPVIVRQIQLTGKIYNDGGKEVERQTIWVGNSLSPKILRGMTLEDIPQLQELKPLKSFEVPPGDSVPFTIVFLKAGKNAKEFTCEVTAANEG